MKYIGLDIRDSDDDVKVTEFIRRIQTEDSDKIILFAQNQWFYWIPRIKDIISAVKEKNKKLNILLGCLTLTRNHYDGISDEDRNFIEIEFWSNWWFSKVASIFFRNGLGVEFFKESVNTEIFKYPFVSLNNRPHLERCLMIDLLQKHDLIDRAALSWANVEQELYPKRFPYSWKYFKPRAILLDRAMGSRDVSRDALEWWNVPDQYMSSFCQLVSETTRRAPFYTEKTMVPLFLGKPFLIAGAPGTHSDLLKVGFLRYSEIFDYSFDEIAILEHRYERLIVDNFVRISNLSLEELSQVHMVLKEKLLYNQQLAMKIAFDLDSWPQIAKDVITIYQETGNNDLCPELVNVYCDLKRVPESELNLFWNPEQLKTLIEIKERNKKLNTILGLNNLDSRKPLKPLGTYEV